MVRCPGDWQGPAVLNPTGCLDLGSWILDLGSLPHRPSPQPSPKGRGRGNAVAAALSLPGRLLEHGLHPGHKGRSDSIPRPPMIPRLILKIEKAPSNPAGEFPQLGRLLRIITHHDRAGMQP